MKNNNTKQDTATTAATGSYAYPGLAAYLKDYIRQALSVLKHPSQLLPTLVLGVIWMVLGIAGANVRRLPMPLWILSFLTYAQGGLYGGLLAAAGGIAGKVVMAAFLNAMIVPLFRGQKPFDGVSGGISGVFRGAAVQGVRAVSPLLGGAGAALLLYGFMNSRQNLQEAMVGIASIVMLLRNIGTKGGFVTGFLFSAAQTFSGGKVPSRVTVDRILSGLTIGFTLALALTLFPFRPCVWTGLVLLLLSLVFGLFGKDAGSGKQQNRPGIFLAAGIIVPALLAGNTLTARAAQPLDWRAYEASDEYTVTITGGKSSQESYLEFRDDDSGVYMGSGVVRYHLLDAETKKEIGYQEVFYKMEDTKGVVQILPEDASYPDIYVDSHGEERNKKHTADQWGKAEAGCYYYDPRIRKDGSNSTTEHTQNHCHWRLNYTGGMHGIYYNLLQDDEEDIISRTASELLRQIPDDMYSDYGRGGNIYRDVHGEDYGIDDGRVIGRYAWQAEEGYSSFSDTNDHHENFEAVFAMYRQLPEVPFILFECDATYYGMMDRVKTDTERMRQRKEPDELMEQYKILKKRIETNLVQDVSTMPIEIAWQEPVWAEPQAGSSAVAEDDEAEESYAMNVPWEGVVKPGTKADDEEAGNADGGASGNRPGGISDTGSAPYFGEDAWGDDYPEEWEHHADTFDTVWRGFLQWLAAILLGGGVGSTLGGGAGGALGGAAGGFPEGPGDGGAESADEGTEPQRRPWSYEDPSSLPKGWKIDREGTLRFRDPVTGERMKYELTGYDEKTGEPRYIDNRGSYFTETVIRDMYDFRERNAHNVALDESTGKRWAQEQHEQNQAKWDEERATGVTEDSRWWSEFKEAQERAEKREAYLENLATQYGKKPGDLKGIKKEIMKESTEAGVEYERQMEKDAWLEFGEKTASQVEAAADTAIDILGEVTGPPGKAIKNAYTFTKPGLKKLSESVAEGKDVYDTMTAIAQGTAEGAIGVLQNEVDGFGMAVGGDMVKTGLNSYLEGKSASQIAEDMEKTAYKSSINYGIGQLISAGGKKVKADSTKGLKDQMSKTSKTFDKMGAWKNMAGDTASKTLARQKVQYQKMMNAKIAGKEKLTDATTSLMGKIFDKYVGDEMTDTIADTKVAENHVTMNNLEELQRKYGSATVKAGSAFPESKESQRRDK